MDLFDLAQVPCFKCQNPTNQLAQQEDSQAICDRCLEAETRKYIRIGLEIQAYEKHIKQMKEEMDHRELLYSRSIHSLQASHVEIPPEEHNEMAHQLLLIQEALAREEMEAATLREQLRLVEEEEERKGREIHQQWISLERIQGELIEEQDFLSGVQQMEERMKGCSKAIEQLIGK